MVASFCAGEYYASQPPASSALREPPVKSAEDPGENRRTEYALRTLTPSGNILRKVSNVLSDEKKKQVIALGQLGWPLRRIEKATGVRRETATGYLKAAGVAIRPPGLGPAPTRKSGQQPDHRPRADSKPANEVTTDAGALFGLPCGELERSPGPSSVCDLYREPIELGLSRGRNAMAIWQDLVDQHGFVKLNSLANSLSSFRKELLRWIGRVAIALTALAILFACSGAIYHVVGSWRDARRFPQRGKSIQA